MQIVTFYCDNCKQKIIDGTTNTNLPTFTMYDLKGEEKHYCRECSELMLVKLNLIFKKEGRL